jgi:hypothetical protein
MSQPDKAYLLSELTIACHGAPNDPNHDIFLEPKEIKKGDVLMCVTKDVLVAAALYIGAGNQITVTSNTPDEPDLLVRVNPIRYE